MTVSTDCTHQVTKPTRTNPGWSRAPGLMQARLLARFTPWRCRYKQAAKSSR
jgi:hypothetical protein